jgi:spore germination protein KA
VLGILLPGFYVAIINFHQEVLPTHILDAILKTRELIPFNLLIEVLIMELAFELIREGGVRAPSPIGPTIGIVGALILGDAAAQANVVSGITILVVSISALCTFTIPDLSFGYTVRILRFAFLFFGAMVGFFGIMFGIYIFLATICNLSSFGVPYVTSYFSKDNYKTGNTMFSLPYWKRERKPRFLKTKKETSTEGVSMSWRK